MERFLKKYTIASAAVILTIMLVFGISLMRMDADPVAQAAGKQGDKYWALGAPIWTGVAGPNFGSNGSGNSTWAVCFPADTNAQPVVQYMEAAGSSTTDFLRWYAANSAITGYTTLSTAFCGGTTTQVRVADASMVQVGGGVSCVAIDNGSGTVGWAELTHGAALTNGAYGLILKSGASNFAQGNTVGQDNLSGVTFPAGSKVFPMFKIAQTLVSSTAITKDNTAGLIAAPKGSPLLCTLESGYGKRTGAPYDANGAGVSLYAVGVQYK